MPLKKDPNGGGTNADGSKSNLFCSLYYQNGEFTQSDMTVTEMQTLVTKQMAKMGFPKFLARFFTKGIPKLERWKSGK